MFKRQMNRKSKLFNHTGTVLCLGLGIAMSPSYSWAMPAADSFTQLPQILRANDAFASLREAYDSVRKDAAAKDLLRDDAINALSIKARVNGLGVETTKFQHYYKGIEVLGSMSFHHKSAKGVQIRQQIARFDLDTNPKITAETAVALAKAAAGDKALAAEPALKILPSAKDKTARLIYWVEMKSQGMMPGADVLVDAQTGKLIANISKMETIAKVNVVSAKSQGLLLTPVLTAQNQLKSCTLKDLKTHKSKKLTASQCRLVVQGESPLIGDVCQLALGDATEADPLMIDPAKCTQLVAQSVASANADDTAQRALDNSNLVLNYYLNTHGRDSYDGQGSDITNAIHVGTHFANAAWLEDLDFMMYGDGDGQLMGDMTKGVDVAGHEMTHGVTAHTAKLTGMGESGALNEANSDFFGKMIANDGTWMMGASLSLDLQKFPGIRDLANPASLDDEILDANGNVVKVPYPAKLSDEATVTSGTCDDSNDNCWVHHNSTIESHARYLVYQAIGKEKAQNLYYLVLTQYLNSQSTFRTAAQAAVSACEATYDSDTCALVTRAYQQTGALD